MKGIFARSGSLHLLIPCAIAAVLASCSSGRQPLEVTQCEAAVARATYRWQVTFSPRGTSRDGIDERREMFGESTLITRNGEAPLRSATGPDENGVWWPELPERPSAREMEARAETLETHSNPVLVRSVDYFLQCDAGDLETDRRTYRRTAETFQAGETLQVSHSLGRVVSVRNRDIAAGSRGDGEGGDLAEDIADGEDIVGALPPTNEIPEVVVPDRETSSQPITIYVDAALGNDTSDNAGSLASPFATITRALAVAESGDTVQIEPGTYDTQTGEIFPLEIPAGVDLRGDDLTSGDGIFVVGGGDFLSPTWARQTVTVVARDRTRISGITFSNPFQRGTAIWLESGSAELANNTFSNNNREGVFVSGTASPEIANNTFTGNGGNGVSFTRTSSGRFEGNTIRDSGYGVAVSETASPAIVNNDIGYNRSGILISGRAQPLVQDNTIADNRQDGIVAIERAAPILRGNQIARNGQYDIQNITNTPLIVEGTDLASLVVEGLVE